MRRPTGPRDPADAWVDGPRGRFWGREGAAGLAVFDPARGVLLQHRVGWSHFGGTWGFPGGARLTGEGALAGGLRESAEEAGVPPQNLAVLAAHVLDLDYWTYTTVLARATIPFEPVIADAESLALAWVPLAELPARPLHPGVEKLWPEIEPHLAREHVLLVDVANVMGSRPNGWWKDRAGAAHRLVEQVAALVRGGVPGPLLGTESAWRVWPRVIAVVEGQAVRADGLDEAAARASHPLDVMTTAGVPASHTGTLEVVRAPRDGDSELLEVAARLQAADPTGEITLVTSDRALRGLAEAMGVRVIGAKALLDALAPDRD